MTQVRDRECMNCGHKWTSPIRLSEFTQNLSGEGKVQCLACNSYKVISYPAYARKTVDNKCYELADFFLQDVPGFRDKHTVQLLAEAIQETIEDFIKEVHGHD